MNPTEVSNVALKLPQSKTKPEKERLQKTLDEQIDAFEQNSPKQSLELMQGKEEQKDLNASIKDKRKTKKKSIKIIKEALSSKSSEGNKQLKVSSDESSSSSSHSSSSSSRSHSSISSVRRNLNSQQNKKNGNGQLSQFSPKPAPAKNEQDQKEVSKFNQKSLLPQKFNSLTVPGERHQDRPASSLNSSRQIPKSLNSFSNRKGTPDQQAFFPQGGNHRISYMKTDQHLNQNSRDRLDGNQLDQMLLEDGNISQGGTLGGHGAGTDLKKFKEENRFRQIVNECIQPLLRTQKNHVVEQTKTANEIIHASSRILDLIAITQKLTKDSECLPSMLSRIQDLEDQVELAGKQSRLNYESFHDKFRMINERFNEQGLEFKHMDYHFQIRDAKIEALEAIVSQHKERIEGVVNGFINEMTQKQENLEKQVREISLQMRSVETFFNSSRAIQDDFVQRLTKVEYLTEQKREEMSSFLEKDFTQLKEHQRQTEQQVRHNMLNLKDLYQQLAVTETRVEPAFQRISHVESFIVKQLPFLIHLHLSDSLQEFLNVQDKFRLIAFDNKKLKEFSDYLQNKYSSSEELLQTEEADEGEDEEEESIDEEQEPDKAQEGGDELSPTFNKGQVDKEEGNKTKIEEPPLKRLNTEQEKREALRLKREEKKLQIMQRLEEKNQRPKQMENENLKSRPEQILHFSKRLDSFLEFLKTKEKGCIRFQYGRDWSLAMGEEELDQIDKSYTTNLETKYQHLQKAYSIIQQKEKQMQEEAEEAIRRRNLLHQQQQQQQQMLEQISASSGLISRSQSRFQLTAGGGQGLSGLNAGGGVGGLLSGASQVIFYKELSVIRHSSKKEALKAAFNARKLRSKQIKERNNQAEFLKRLLKEQDELDSNADYSMSSSDLEEIEEYQDDSNLSDNQNRLKIPPAVQGRPGSSSFNKKTGLLGSMVFGQGEASGMLRQSDLQHPNVKGIRKNRATSVNKYKRLYQRQFTEIKHLFDVDDVASSKFSHAQKQAQEEGKAKSSAQRRVRKVTDGAMSMISIASKGQQDERSSLSPPQKDQTSNSSQMRGQRKFYFPDQIKERMQLLLTLGFRQTQKLQKKMSRLIKIHRDQAQAQNTLIEKGISKIKKSKQKFSDMVDFLDQKITEQITKYSTTMNSVRGEFQEFKEHILTEYIDFFKHRQRIRTEISVMIKETNDRLDSFTGQMDRFTSNHETVNQIIPLLIESLGLIQKSLIKDNLDREKLSEALRFQEAPNDGYLMLQNTEAQLKHHPKLQKQIDIPPLKEGVVNLPTQARDFVNENILSQSIPKDQTQHLTLSKISAHQPEVPLPSLFQGSLHLKTVDYRNVTLSIQQISYLLSQFNAKMMKLIENQPIFTSILLTPKNIFDDYYLAMIGCGGFHQEEASSFNTLKHRAKSAQKVARPSINSSNVALVAFSNNVIQGSIEEIRIKRQKSRNQMSSGGVGTAPTLPIDGSQMIDTLPTEQTEDLQQYFKREVAPPCEGKMLDRFKAGSREQSRQGQRVVNLQKYQDGFTQTQLQSSDKKLTSLERIQQMTRKLNHHQIERESKLKEYLNRTFDESQGSQLLITNTHDATLTLEKMQSTDSQVTVQRFRPTKGIWNDLTGSPLKRFSPHKLASPSPMLLLNSSLSGTHQRATTAANGAIGFAHNFLTATTATAQQQKSRNAFNQSFSSLGAMVAAGNPQMNTLSIKQGKQDSLNLSNFNSTNYGRMLLRNQESSQGVQEFNIGRASSSMEGHRKMSLLNQSFTRAGGGFNQNPNPQPLQLQMSNTIALPQTSLGQYVKRRQQQNNTTLSTAGQNISGVALDDITMSSVGILLSRNQAKTDDSKLFKSLKNEQRV